MVESSVAYVAVARCSDRKVVASYFLDKKGRRMNKSNRVNTC
jgi:hypothetical protein